MPAALREGLSIVQQQPRGHGAGGACRGETESKSQFAVQLARGALFPFPFPFSSMFVFL